MNLQNTSHSMRVLSAKEIAEVSGGIMGSLPSGAVAGAGQVANSSNVCDYHHMQDRVYCYNDALGPDAAYWVD
ncbi:MAG: hypothetical protein AB7E55_13795 [Pigmentiphaga sp.]